jgi:hypothetical protein
MYNNQMPQVSMPTGGGSVVEPKSVAPVAPVEKKDHSTVVFVIIIVFLAILMVTFFGLFIWKLMDYNEISTDVNGQIEVAVAAAKDEQATKDEQEFLEREKYPFQYFSGPADYGQLTFQYPKTWSVYIASDASKGGDFKAYLNPVQVDEVSDKTINALRVSILTKDFESTAASYQNYVNNKEANLRMESITLTSGVAANKYIGTIPGTELNGIVVIFKIRDKTAVLQTDSAFFETDFNKLLETVQFNA